MVQALLARDAAQARAPVLDNTATAVVDADAAAYGTVAGEDRSTSSGQDGHDQDAPVGCPVLHNVLVLSKGWPMKMVGIVLWVPLDSPTLADAVSMAAPEVPDV